MNYNPLPILANWDWSPISPFEIRQPDPIWECDWCEGGPPLCPMSMNTNIVTVAPGGSVGASSTNLNVNVLSMPYRLQRMQQRLLQLLSQ